MSLEYICFAALSSTGPPKRRNRRELQIEGLKCDHGRTTESAVREWISDLRALPGSDSKINLSKHIISNDGKSDKVTLEFVGHDRRGLEQAFQQFCDNIFHEDFRKPTDKLTSRSLLGISPSGFQANNAFLASLVRALGQDPGLLSNVRLKQDSMPAGFPDWAVACAFSQLTGIRIFDFQSLNDPFSDDRRTHSDAGGQFLISMCKYDENDTVPRLDAKDLEGNIQELVKVTITLQKQLNKNPNASDVLHWVESVTSCGPEAAVGITRLALNDRGTLQHWVDLYRESNTDARDVQTVGDLLAAVWSAFRSAFRSTSTTRASPESPSRGRHWTALYRAGVVAASGTYVLMFGSSGSDQIRRDNARKLYQWTTFLQHMMNMRVEVTTLLEWINKYRGKDTMYRAFLEERDPEIAKRWNQFVEECREAVTQEHEELSYEAKESKGALATESDALRYVEGYLGRQIPEARTLMQENGPASE